jgi:uncharacterized protein YcnI
VPNCTPDKPTLLTPANGAGDVSRTPTLTTIAYSDPQSCSTHWKTRWQISENQNFNGLTFNANTINNDLTSLQVSKLVLKPNTTYYWRVRYWGDTGNQSAWSDAFSLTTEDAIEDQDSNGIPDDQEVDGSVDLDNNGIPDRDENHIRSVNTAVGEAQMGVSRSTNVNDIEAVEAVDQAVIDDTENRPDGMPVGLLSFRLKVDNVGDTATVIVYLSKPLKSGTKWHSYEPIAGWQDYSEHVTISADRKSVTLELKDGGFGDADGIANGVIVDPSGPGTTSSGSGGSGGGGCFIDTAAYGFRRAK